MRISQITKKYNLSTQQIAAFLKDLEHPTQSIHPNAKVDDDVWLLLKKHFDLQEETTDYAEVGSENEAIVDLPSEQMENHDQKIEVAKNEDVLIPENRKKVEESRIETMEEAETMEDKVSEEDTSKDESQSLDETECAANLDDQLDTKETEESQVILSDQLLEMIENENIPNEEVDKIKLIKAPKKKLSGLKVLDKIELPEDPKNKKQEEPNPPRFTPEERAERARKREEFKEKNRLEAKKKQEINEARKAKRIKEKEAKHLKKIKEQHYKEKLRKAESSSFPQKRKKVVKPSTPAISATYDQAKSHVKKKEAQPKTLLGKFWKWLNT